MPQKQPKRRHLWLTEGSCNFIPRSPDAELVIRAIEPKPGPQAIN